MFVSKKSFNQSLRYDLNRTAGYREKNIMNNSRHVTSSGFGRFLTFTMSNPNYGKTRYETTKTYRATYDKKRKTWIN